MSDEQIIKGEDLTPEQRAVFEQGQQPKAPKPDPAIIDYVLRKWHQMLDPMRTACFRCGAESPVIFLTMGGVTTFGGPVNKARGEFDNTAEVQAKLAKHGWVFELRRSYCPSCKGLGSTA
ncbi:MAG TPA: hypothetical protein VF760_12460 [Xanthobacteraceae bacterium]